jgi:NADH dehydrogenase
LLAWGVIHIAYLVGWGSRLETITRWGWTLLARNRRERLISVSSLAEVAPGTHESGLAPGVGNGQRQHSANGAAELLSP